VTEDQELMWAMLKSEPQKLCHLWAEEMMSVKTNAKEMNALADDYVLYMLNRFSHIDTCRTIKTWLTTYALPIEPERISSFDQFHINCGRFVLNNIDVITVFER